MAAETWQGIVADQLRAVKAHYEQGKIRAIYRETGVGVLAIYDAADAREMDQLLAGLPMALRGGAPALALLWFAKPWYSHSLATIVAAGFVGGVLCLAGCGVTAVGLKDTNLIIGSLRSRVLRAR